MLSRGQEECPIDQWISVEDQHLFLTKDAMNSGPSVARQGRQDKTSRVVIAVVSLVLHLQQVQELVYTALNLAGTRPRIDSKLCSSKKIK